MTKLPLSCLFYLSTSGHFGYDTYATTINHYRAKLGGTFDIFHKVYAHVKVKPDERTKLEPILAFLKANDITAIVTEGDWKRGLIHGQAYMADMLKMYDMQDLHEVPYLFAVEDDSPINVKSGDLTSYLTTAVSLLAANKDVLHVRFQRDSALNITQPLTDLLNRVDTWDLQPSISRVRDLYLILKIVHDNAAQLANTQCEQALRIAADTLSYSPNRYLCFNPNLANSYHIGVPAYPDIVKGAEFSDLKGAPVKDAAYLYNHFKDTVNDRDKVFKGVIESFGKQPVKILEIGCARSLNPESKGGDGWSSLFWAEYLSQYGGSLVIVDIDQGNLDNCKTLLSRFAALDITFICDDGLNHIDASYDLIYLDGADDPKQMINQFNRIDRAKTAILCDDFHSKGAALRLIETDFVSLMANKTHEMALYPKKAVVL